MMGGADSAGKGGGLQTQNEILRNNIVVVALLR
jgi:hypothetical protein